MITHIYIYSVTPHNNIQNMKLPKSYQELNLNFLKLRICAYDVSVTDKG